MSSEAGDNLSPSLLLSVSATICLKLHTCVIRNLCVYFAVQEPFAPDVEDEANRTFQSIYSETQPMSDVVTMLAAFKNSEVPREQTVFKCMIHNLFDEYRFFPR